MKAAWVIDPNKAVFRDLFIILTDPEDEGGARLKLHTKFAQIVLGEQFPVISTEGAWHIWQVAEANGFRIHVANVESTL